MWRGCRQRLPQPSKDTAWPKTAKTNGTSSLTRSSSLPVQSIFKVISESNRRASSLKSRTWSIAVWWRAAAWPSPLWPSIVIHTTSSSTRRALLRSTRQYRITRPIATNLAGTPRNRTSHPLRRRFHQFSSPERMRLAEASIVSPVAAKGRDFWLSPGSAKSNSTEDWCQSTTS